MGFKFWCVMHELTPTQSKSPSGSNPVFFHIESEASELGSLCVLSQLKTVVSFELKWDSWCWCSLAVVCYVCLSLASIARSRIRSRTSKLVLLLLLGTEPRDSFMHIPSNNLSNYGLIRGLIYTRGQSPGFQRLSKALPLIIAAWRPSLQHTSFWGTVQIQTIKIAPLPSFHWGTGLS